MTRTDIHRPSAPEFDPEAYDLHGVFDLHPDYPAPEMAQARLAIVNGLIAQGYRFGSHGSRQCGHCGHVGIRYAALMIRADVREMIYVGEDCLDNRFDLTKAEFTALRESARLNRERTARRDRVAALVDAHPLLAWLTYPSNVTGLDSEFFYSIGHKLTAYGELSDRQVAAVERGIIRETERNDRRAAQAAAKRALVDAGVQAPEGRMTVTGQIVSLKEREGYMGGTEWKITVKTDEGWLAWASAPSLLWDAWRDAKADMDLEQWLRTQRLTFTVTLTRSDSDPLFAFAKRPAKASLVAA